MKIDPNKRLVGLPILEIRRLLRRSQNVQMWNIQFIKEILDISVDKATEVIKNLEEEGYVEPVEFKNDEQYWTNTVKGNSLALASAAKPIKRTSAEKKLAEFLIRVKQANESPEFLYKVKKVTVFGSYLSFRETIGDIDLVVELAPKVQDREEQRRLNQERIRQAYKKGRQFGNIVEELFWPQREVMLFLKGRARTFSLHSLDDLKLAKKYEVIFEEKE